MKVQTTKTFEDLLNPNFRNYVFQGASRAGKSYNIVLWMVINLLNEENKVYSIVRKTLPALKASILRDLKEILQKLDLYDSNKWHIVDGYVEIGSNVIEWFGLDTEERVRGRKRDVCFINEATEISYEEYVQLNLRTSERMILDFNPSLWQSWLYDLEGQPDTFYTIVTYKDNPFLAQNQIDEIEKLQHRDQNLWRVFGLGQKGIPTRLVFNHQQIYDELPKTAKLLGYGSDIGFKSSMMRPYARNFSLYRVE